MHYARVDVSVNLDRNAGLWSERDWSHPPGWWMVVEGTPAVASYTFSQAIDKDEYPMENDTSSEGKQTHQEAKGQGVSYVALLADLVAEGKVRRQENTREKWMNTNNDICG